MYCSDTEIEKRIRKRNTSRIMNIERAVECNTKIKQLKSDFLLDTSSKETYEVVKIFCDFVNGGNL